MLYKVEPDEPKPASRKTTRPRRSERKVSRVTRVFTSQKTSELLGIETNSVTNGAVSESELNLTNEMRFKILTKFVGRKERNPEEEAKGLLDLESHGPGNRSRSHVEVTLEELFCWEGFFKDLSWVILKVSPQQPVADNLGSNMTFKEQAEVQQESYLLFSSEDVVVDGKQLRQACVRDITLMWAVLEESYLSKSAKETNKIIISQIVTPICQIIDKAQAVEEKIADRELRQTAKIIRVRAELLEIFCSYKLDLNRLNSNCFKLKVRPTNLYKLLASARDVA